MKITNCSVLLHSRFLPTVLKTSGISSFRKVRNPFRKDSILPGVWMRSGHAASSSRSTRRLVCGGAAYAGAVVLSTCIKEAEGFAAVCRFFDFIKSLFVDQPAGEEPQEES
ncbi:hypothetical protein HPB50_004231 [Hyalomma asiaticum]|uniref:Uncharacterized protein n=1 Tax=Hyalomma asiaticum TaxID=266040 RepID=A0ACB7T7W0_HYAAI|nr:hypothetical protein HPB50_004231 [Hyalomma asiaticum]